MKTQWLLILVYTLTLSFSNPAAWSAEFCVNPSGSGESDFETALDTAETNGEHDVIKVVQGTYVGNYYYISYEGNNLTIEGGYTAGCADRDLNPVNTILDGSGESEPVLNLSNANNGGNIEVDGLTLKNGYSFDISGGGAYIISSSAIGTAGDIIFSNNFVTQNESPVYQGGGVFAVSTATSGNAGTVSFINNIISDNSTAGSGGGAYIVSSSDSISGETITLLNNTISGNNSGLSGGGVYIGTDSNTINFFNNIIWGNTSSSTGDDIFFTYTGNGIQNGYYNDYSDVDPVSPWDNAIGNIDANPMLNSKYHLRRGSPCIDTATNLIPDSPSTDIDGDARVIDGDGDNSAVTDIGADEYIPKGLLSFLMLLLN